MTKMPRAATIQNLRLAGSACGIIGQITRTGRRPEAN